jgi:hypothetical protein
MSFWMMEFSLTAFGTFLVGLLAEYAGAQMSMAVPAIALIVFCLGMLLFLPRLRELP